MRILIILILIISITFTSCEEENYTPKPRIYPKIEFPERAYKDSETDFCAFTFQQPTATNVEQKKEYFEGLTAERRWREG